MTDPVAAPVPTSEVAAPEIDVVATPIESKPKPRRRGLKIAAIAVGALVLVGGALGITYAVGAAQHTPDKQVTAFLQNLVDGKAEAALSLVVDAPTGNDALLTDEVYSAATDRITAFEITESKADGATATVTAALTQGSETYDYTFDLTRVDSDVVWDVWNIDGTAIPGYEVSFARPDGVEPTVNGASLGLTSAFERFVPALPGTYEFAASGTTDSYTVEPVSETVTFASEGPVNASLAVVLTEAGQAAARAAYSAHLGGCLSQQTIHPPDDCGFYVIDEGYTYSNIRWTVGVEPVFTFGDWRPDTFEESGWFIILETPGRIDFAADITTATQYGSGTATFEGYKPQGYISGFDESGVATFKSFYTAG